VFDNRHIAALRRLVEDFASLEASIVQRREGRRPVANDKYDGSFTVSNFAIDNASETRFGGVVGVGLEFAVSPNVLLGVDYQRAFMGTNSVTFAPNVPIVGFPVSRIENIR
jgi:outer membrane immunogenic protein